jgi:hypothetical protein
MSQKKKNQTRGKHLIDIFVGKQLKNFNGRLAGDSFGKFSCHTYNGSSTVDYVIVSEPLLFEIPLKSDICFWKWGFDKVFWNFISEVSSHIYCLGNGISVDVLTDGRILYLDRCCRFMFENT